MWISQQMNKTPDEPAVQKGRVTLNDNGELEAVSTGVERNLDIFSPFGYIYSVPTGTDMILTRCDGNQGAVGVRMKNAGLEFGEIKIVSSSGAYIYLKNDGSVIINGLKISKTGEIDGK